MRLTIHIRQAKTVSSVSDSVQMCTVRMHCSGHWEPGTCRRARAQYVGPWGRTRAGGLDLGTLLQGCRLEAWKDGSIGKMQVQYLMTEFRAKKCASTASFPLKKMIFQSR